MAPSCKPVLDDIDVHPHLHVSATFYMLLYMTPSCKHVLDDTDIHLHLHLHVTAAFYMLLSTHSPASKTLWSVKCHCWSMLWFMKAVDAPISLQCFGAALPPLQALTRSYN